MQSVSPLVFFLPTSCMLWGWDGWVLAESVRRDAKAVIAEAVFAHSLLILVCTAWISRLGLMVPV